jgi:two-component system, sensor histidine kinase PdtaS
MSLLSKIIVLFLFCLVGCKKNADRKINAANHSISNLIKQAEDAIYPLDKRLLFASQADSLAMLENDKKQLLETKRTKAGLNLMLGNLSFAQKDYLKAADVAMAIKDFENLGIAYHNLGIIYDKKSQFDTALQFYNDAIQNFRKNGNQLQIARTMTNIGIVYQNQENYDTAFKIVVTAANIFDGLKAQKELASVYTTLGIILKQENQFDEALQYYERALKIFTSEKDSSGMSSILVNIGNVFRYEEQFEKALNYYLNALSIKRKIGLSKYTGATLENIGEVFSLMNNFYLAEDYLRKALDIRIDNHDKDGELSTLNKLSKLYLKGNNFFKAKDVAIQTQYALPQSGFLKQKLNNTLLLHEIYDKLGQYDSASKYANYALTLKDTLFNADMTENLAKMDAMFRTQETQKDLFLSQEKQKTQSVQIYAQQKFIFLLSFFLFLLFSLLILLFRLYTAIKKANKRIETLMKELNHRVKNNLQIVSDMLNLQLGFVKDKDQAALIQSSINRVQSMNVIHTLLYQKGFTGMINMHDFMKELLLNIANAYREKSDLFDMKIEVQNFYLHIDKAIPVGLITNELVTNIYKFSKVVDGTHMDIKLANENKNCTLEIADNCGYWNVEKVKEQQHGLGLILVETFVKQLKGTWNTVSSEKENIQYIEFSK